MKSKRIKKYLGVALCVFLLQGIIGCATLFSDFPESSEYEKKQVKTKQKLFAASFDETWRAVQLALVSYPIRTNNMDQGVIETDNIPSYRGWSPPHRKVKKSGGLSYRLIVRIIKGHYDENKKVTKVIIQKKIQLKRSFFSEEQELESDGLEETTLLYRIKRELELTKILNKAN